MSVDRPKKRLTLMNEVLPDPTQNQDGAGSPAAVRTRTLEHMKRLLAGTAAASALVGCSSDGAQPEPKGSAQSSSKPATSASASATASATASSTASAEATASVSASASASATPGASAVPSATVKPSATAIKPPPHPTGYMVVDPMPNPSRR